ncbi:hypothetical protein H9L10_02915 [Phycicoccus endophyticus]|uniref:Uncharacterized protein n=1 Tax=Phycicoccus endophyticus TaxID=1690220 RepID=A0A7G9R370_9MICO|nr:hypothetical protein [Phycicoccus endophyticus]NHI19784.1 hypothetical protein [Phycicoccus endophyticus]QNN50045.1 hypothetical protein H9L10_02915 [Phycicoccus endophyticus]GGL28627.1 hypothetical protein GCM10012283_08540 [Phycicoccus endophyticus]
MPLTRVYLPLTAADLEALVDGMDLGPPPLAAHGVTPALAGPGRPGDAEELEHLAWVAASEEAEALRERDERRVVAAADLDAGAVTVPAAGEVPSRVEVQVPVPRSRLVSFHVDEHRGDTGTADLLWYDVTELDAVLTLLAAG